MGWRQGLSRILRLALLTIPIAFSTHYCTHFLPIHNNRIENYVQVSDILPEAVNGGTTLVIVSRDMNTPDDYLQNYVDGLQDSVDFYYMNEWPLKHKVDGVPFCGDRACMEDWYDEVNSRIQALRNISLDLDGSIKLINVEPSGSEEDIYYVENHNKTIYYQVSNKFEFFKVLRDQEDGSIDHLVIDGHGATMGISFDLWLTERYEEGIVKTFIDRILLNREVYTQDIINLSGKEVDLIRSKMSDTSNVYLISCSTLQNYETFTSIAESLAYLFDRPVFACISPAGGHAPRIDIAEYPDPYFPEEYNEDFIDLTYKGTVGSCKWKVVYPKHMLE